ncbi:MAG: NAD(P)H-dependent oxidoreductase subunit E [Gudongella sp.]|nr:NAD(P)H-dependent oxidoreductase subunit E [Gudongella sp.]
MEFKFDQKKFSDEITSFKKMLIDKKDSPGPLMPALQQAQELFGYLPKEILGLISKELSIPLAEIYGVATFYSQFSFIPKGENRVSVCLGTACYVKGSQTLLEELEVQLNIKSGSTSLDQKFSLDSARCVGDCSIAPIVIVNDDVYAKVKKNEIAGILAKYK